MAPLKLNPSVLATLSGKVVVLTGGSTGIGREAVRLFHEHGASVVFGDINASVGSTYASSFNSHHVKFQLCDASSYQDQLAIFKLAVKEFGKIDVVVANAGIGSFVDPFLAEADIEIEPTTKEIDVNLKGALFTARLGNHFLRAGGGGEMVLVSSIAGFKESVGLVTYTASKHGVVGIMRGLRVQAMMEGVRINVVCPWMTKTGMVKGIETGWRERNLPENQPEDVARSILICSTANNGKEVEMHGGATGGGDFWGKILYVAGGESYEIEDKIWELEPQWLGVENSRILEKGQAFLMEEGVSWDTGEK